MNHDMHLTLDQKVDRILQVIEGEGDDQPGVIGQLAEIRRDFYGVKNELGVKAKMAIVWRVHVWLLCSASALIGIGLDTLWHQIK